MTAKFDFEWDDAKAESNLRKHGISFQAATLAFEDSHVAEVDASRASDGEIRTKAIALIDGYFVCVVFTLRGRTVRLISARRGAQTQRRRSFMAIVRYRFDPANPPKMTEAERQFLDNLTPEQIEQNALDDPDNPPFTDEELERLSIAAPIQRTRRGMGLTQVQFSERFHINLARLRDWEQGRYKPDSALLAYLKVIAKEPEAVMRALGSEAREEAAE